MLDSLGGNGAQRDHSEQNQELRRQALQPVRTAVTLRRKRGELSFTDGPFAETKEELAGFIMIEAPEYLLARRVTAVESSSSRGH